ncbi:hypothetical protein HPB51_003413 [Rhipicephalus microplus]|uniref:M13 family peptidase n=1 Tax=Rhipicephalus microplus TaxID=6941 RepID=A0A9J6DF38_RHIMP|nr:hypothetical protein HPB51_003413 [Rhipicephalus microplus]
MSFSKDMKDSKDSKDPVNVEVTTGTLRESSLSRGSSHKAHLRNVIALFVAALALAGGVLLFGRWLTYEPIVGLCETAGCEKHVEELKAAMNTSADPCNDFYNFTCGSWKPVGNEKSLIARVFASSAAIAMKEMQGDPKQSLVPAAPLFYQSCVGARIELRSELEIFKNFKQDMGLMWPEKAQNDATNPLTLLLNLSINWNFHMFFHMKAMPVYKKRSQTLYMRRGLMTPKWQDLSEPRKWTANVREHCKLLRANLPDSSFSELEDVVKDLMNAAISIPPDATNDTEFALKDIEHYTKPASSWWRDQLNALHGPQFAWTLNSPTDLATLYRNFPRIRGSFVENFIAIAKAYRKVIGEDSFITIFSKRLGGGDASRYNYYYNIAFVALGAMEPPILYDDGTLAMRYGSLGMMLAQCMVRSFDIHGVFVNKAGENEAWWGASEDLQKRLHCDLLGGQGGPTGGPGSRRQSALFPLVNGMHVAFAAYRSEVALTYPSMHGVDEFRLRGLEEFSEDQLFFLTYCLTTCALNSNGDACNVPMRHSAKFATAFRCPPRSRMNPSDKCLFFD